MALLSSQSRNPTIGGVILVAALLMAAFGTNNAGFAIVLTLAVLIAVPFVFRLLTYHAAKDKILAAVNQHMAALVRRREQLRTVDAYGSIQTGKWVKEIKYFYDTQISATLSQGQRKAVAMN